MPQELDDMSVLQHKHAQNVITGIADLHTYVALTHAISIIGYNTEVYLPREGKRESAPETLDEGGRVDLFGAPVLGDYEPETRTGSLYNPKDHEYLYEDKPDFIARLAFLDPQDQPAQRGTELLVDETNTAYTLKRTNGKRNYCPGDIQLYSKLLVHYGHEDLSYFVQNIKTLRNPNAKNAEDEALIYLDLVIHI